MPPLLSSVFKRALEAGVCNIPAENRASPEGWQCWCPVHVQSGVPSCLKWEMDFVMGVFAWSGENEHWVCRE